MQLTEPLPGPFSACILRTSVPGSTYCIMSISLLALSPCEWGAVGPHIETETAALFDPVSLLWLPASTAIWGLEVEIKVPAR